MPFVSGFLRLRSRAHPGHDLPDVERPVDPGYGMSGDMIDNELPAPPPGMWPPATIGNPIVPVVPDNTLPIAPGTIWPPPGRPAHPGGGPVPPAGSTQPLPGGGRPDNALPSGVARPGHDLPSRVFWMLCYCPTLGWTFVAVDPSLQPGMGLPSAPARPSQELPETAQPRRS